MENMKEEETFIRSEYAEYWVGHGEWYHLTHSMIKNIRSVHGNNGNNKMTPNGKWKRTLTDSE